MSDYLIAAFLGVIEGLTEFLPVSSTGHLILFVDLLGFQAPEGRTFEVMVQLGAILAITTVFYKKIFGTAFGLTHDKTAQRFAVMIVVAFLPAMVLGALFHSTIKSVLFDPMVVAISLIIGGFVMLIVDRLVLQRTVHSVDDIPVKTAFFIGCAQCIAMIPGVSRSGATIVGGTLLGLDKRVAAEFSFFLALPTMAGAFVFDAYKNWHLLSFDDLGLIGIGFVTAFLSALVIVKPFLAIIARSGFWPFALYRILLGSLVLLFIM